MRWKVLSLVGAILFLGMPTLGAAKDPDITITTKGWRVTLASYECDPATALYYKTPANEMPPKDSCIFDFLWDWTNLGPSGAYHDPSLSLILLDEHGNRYSPNKYQSDHMIFAQMFDYTKTWNAQETRTLTTKFFVPKGVKLVAVFSRDGSFYLSIEKQSYYTFDLPSPTPENNAWGS